ncbi:MAG: PolC-type DNA polymerase III [Candidatus Melainabacteria bacterium]
MMQQSLFGMMEPATTATLANPLAQPLEEAVFTVVDLETTGLQPRKNAITEITAIRFKNGEDLGMYSTLVRPTEPIGEWVENMTGITNEMVKDAPALVEVLAELLRFAGTDALWVGHNVPFDIGFLQEKLHETGLSSQRDRIRIEQAFCTRNLARKALPGLPSYEGIVVATACGVDNKNPHRAEYDVRMSAGILFALIDRLKLEQPGIRTVGDLLSYQGVLNL